MTYLKKTGQAILIVMGLSLFSACSNATEQVVYTRQISVVCDVLKGPVNKHMTSIVDNGEAIIGAGASEVVVTGSELSDVYDKSC